MVSACDSSEPSGRAKGYVTSFALSFFAAFCSSSQVLGGSAPARVKRSSLKNSRRVLAPKGMPYCTRSTSPAWRSRGCQFDWVGTETRFSTG